MLTETLVGDTIKRLVNDLSVHRHPLPTGYKCLLNSQWKTIEKTITLGDDVCVRFSSQIKVHPSENAVDLQNWLSENCTWLQNQFWSITLQVFNGFLFVLILIASIVIHYTFGTGLQVNCRGPILGFLVKPKSCVENLRVLPTIISLTRFLVPTFVGVPSESCHVL